MRKIEYQINRDNSPYITTKYEQKPLTETIVCGNCGFRVGGFRNHDNQIVVLWDHRCPEVERMVQQ